MSKELNVLIACGSGVATSTIALNSVKETLEAAGISGKFFKCSLGEVESKQKTVDLVLTTSNYKKALEVPHMSVFGLISGVNEDLVKEKLVQLCNNILNS